MKEETTTSDQKILIFTEAGKEIGFGHLMRCLAIRDELKLQGVEAIIVANLVEMISPDPEIIKLDWVKAPSELDSFKQVDLVLVDSYLASEAVFHSLQSTFPNLAVIDDYNRIVYPADYIFNPNVFFEQVDYALQNARIEGGKEYVILRSVFRENNSKVLVRDKVEHILITIGGSDFRNLLPRLINFCLKQKRISVKVVDPEGLSSHLATTSVEVLGEQTADQMYLLMCEADIVISACGQSLNELASLGKPVIGICLDIDQLPNQKYYFKKGFLKQEIHWDSDNLETLILENIEYLSPKIVRESLSTLGVRLVDKNGVSRLCNNLLSLTNGGL